MDSAIEDLVRQCYECQSQRNSPPKSTLHPWEYPKKAWSRLHIDYAGPFLGQMFLVVSDAYSKWLEVMPVGHVATSLNTIEHLRAIFCVHGLPETLVSDNGTVFTSGEFAVFTRMNGIRHIFSPPYHPATNGLAERTVQTFKRALKRMRGHWRTNLCRFLFQYRITPHPVTGHSPAEMLMSRRLRCTLDKLHPDMNTKVEQSQRRQVENHNRHASISPKYTVGDKVFVRNFLSGPKWLDGEIIDVKGPVSYNVKMCDSGRIMHRHVEHLRERWCDPPATMDTTPVVMGTPTIAPIPAPVPEPVAPSTPSVVAPVEKPVESPRVSVPVTTATPVYPTTPVVRRSTRTHVAPQKLNL